MKWMNWLACCGWLSLQALSTYFCYEPEDLANFYTLKATTCINAAELCHWDDVASKVIAKANMSHRDALRVYTYLYRAQADAAALSDDGSGEYTGSIGPLSSDVLSLFLPDVPREKGSPYSERLAQIVVAKLKERLACEEKNEPSFTVPKASIGDYRDGLDIARWTPWVLECPSAYWPDCPPEVGNNIWEWQICDIKEAQNPMTRAKKRVVRYWAGMGDAGSGDWRILANCFIFSCDRPMADILDARWAIVAALHDGAIVTFGSKYEYMIPRPTELDKSIETVIEVPNNPSYPSGHALAGAAAAAVLCYYFPGHCAQWQSWAEQDGYSRIWAGLHYPLDMEAGMMSGMAVGNAVAECSN